MTVMSLPLSVLIIIQEIISVSILLIITQRLMAFMSTVTVLCDMASYHCTAQFPRLIKYILIQLVKIIQFIQFAFPIGRASNIKVYENITKDKRKNKIYHKKRSVVLLRFSKGRGFIHHFVDKLSQFQMMQAIPPCWRPSS